MRTRVLVGALLLVVAAPLLASLAGFGLVVFSTGSMAPAIEPGSVALVASEHADRAEVGDIVSVLPDDGGDRVTHRVTAVIGHGADTALELRGDANPAPDRELYSPGRVDRVVAVVPHVGPVVAWLARHRLLLLGAAVVAGTSHVCSRRSGLRRSPNAQARAMASLAAVATVALVGGQAVATRAYFTDVATLQSGTSSASTVPAPTLGCGMVAPNSVELTWVPVDHASSYTVHHDGTTTTVAGTSIVLSAPATDAEAFVVANRAFPSVTWQSASSNSVTYTVDSISACS